MYYAESRMHRVVCGLFLESSHVPRAYTVELFVMLFGERFVWAYELLHNNTHHHVGLLDVLQKRSMRDGA